MHQATLQTEEPMHFSFIAEERPRGERMPIVARHLPMPGQSVEVLEPAKAVTCESDLVRQSYDAFVLKAVSDGPGATGLPCPRTYFVADPRLLETIPETDYPLYAMLATRSTGERSVSRARSAQADQRPVAVLAHSPAEE